MKINNNVSRRGFLKISGLTGAGLALGFYFQYDDKEPKILKTEEAKLLDIELNAHIFIDTSGQVTIINHRAEMGQGAFQAIPQIIAEELEVDLNKIKVVFAQGDNKKYGSQITGGSSTVWRNYKPLSRLGASAREMLLEAAAKRWNIWNIDKKDCYAENGEVFSRLSEKKFHYGQLVEEASTLTPPDNVSIKKPHEYKLLRQPLPRLDIPLKTNGAAIFGIDKKVDGMLYAVVERNRRFLGKVKDFDDTETRKVPGVKHVFPVKMTVFATFREGVAVVADTLWAAMQGRKVLRVTWDDGGFEHWSTPQLYSQMRNDLKSKEGLLYKAKGNFEKTYKNAAKKIEASYETPYQAHACLEPLNCIAHVHDGICEIWGPIQAPDWVQDSLSQSLEIPNEKIMVNMTFLGGGFGRKAFMDYPHEAAIISKEIGAPVQVVWTREDDMNQGPFRPGMVYQCHGGLNESGGLDALEFTAAGQNMNHQWPGTPKDSYNSLMTEGLLDRYYESIPNYRFTDIPLDTPIPVMWWRSVYASTNAFPIESFFDEVAHEAKKDPLDFRRQYLEGERYHLLIDKLEEVSGWKKRDKNQGYGVAITQCFFSTVGEVVKVSKTPSGQVKIDKVWAVMDCGSYVNPDIIRAQVEGSIVMALGAATNHETTFDNGEAVHQNFDTYKMPRIAEIPDIEVHIMENNESPGGVGEPALPPFAPALCNAIFDLTGKRIRKLPFNLNEV